ncbi:MAG TPA: penicillin-insensitive murein endopeptidase [Bdellovibrionales bacterium]|nr:penicillin-insensitive murein endopeptidase [Bdellovibrionales bacterium]HCM40211.1 penicillin-insensitive murein endopeptidase [Bdellovibrionales bacterium]
MSMKSVVVLALVFCTFCFSCSGLRAKEYPWANIQTTSRGTPLSIGAGSAGCLQGALSLPPDGPGFYVMRISRKRFYGHPDLVRAIREISLDAQKSRLGTLLIGDLSQARGGPMNSMHVSHQAGLNVDIWIQQAEDFSPVEMTLDARENLWARSVLHPGKMELNPEFWSEKKTELLRNIALRKDLNRVLVSPAIKKHLCSRFNTAENTTWLSKVRPWYGHDDHFHLAFNCPEGDLSCIFPKPVTLDNACDATLEWWWSDEAQKLAEAPTEEKPSPALPEQCAGLLIAD